MKSVPLFPTSLLLAVLSSTPLVAQDKAPLGIETKVQVAAYYFPNWGPVAQSEWSQIKAAVPRFDGHAQPKIPVWGYENENDPAVMARKISAAADHGLTETATAAAEIADIAREVAEASAHDCTLELREFLGIVSAELAFVV
jgi:hypothetical protein